MAGDVQKIQSRPVRGEGAMIFVTVGTEKFPFERLIKTIDEAKQNEIIKEEVFMQIGANFYQPAFCKFVKFLSYNQMMYYIQSARIIVSHAGIGSTLLCLHSGKVPILFPRSAAHHEHLDDHQLDFANHLKELSKALVCFDTNDLLDKIINYKDYINDLTIDTKRKEHHRLVAYLHNNIES